ARNTAEMLTGCASRAAPLKSPNRRSASRPQGAAPTAEKNAHHRFLLVGFFLVHRAFPGKAARILRKKYSWSRWPPPFSAGRRRCLALAAQQRLQAVQPLARAGRRVGL